MAELTMAAGAARKGRAVPWAGFALALIAGVMLVLVPLGWRLGLWHYRVSFRYFMTPVPFIAAAAALVSLVALIRWGGMSGAGRTAALLGFLGGAVLIYYPLHFYAEVAPLPLLHNTPLPRIHDITTDTQDPPQFAATLAARTAEKGNPTLYGGLALARQQRAGYPDLAPLETGLPKSEAFRRALAAAEAMPRWTIVASDPEAGTIEGSARTLFMGFTDDFVIRVRPEAGGSRIDMRSESRQGGSDFGANAERIRSYMTALKPKLG